MTAATTIEQATDGDVVRLRVAGRLTVARLGQIEATLADLIGGGERGRTLVLDLSAVERIDTAGAWIVHRTMRDWRGPARLEGASPQAERLVEAVTAGDRPIRIRPDHSSPVRRFLARIGRHLILNAQTVGSFLAFLGATLVALGRALGRRRGIRVNAIVHQMEVAGVNALPIVGLMSFLVGVVLAQQGAIQLRQFGADVFVINLIGRSVIRELGLLLAAIMVAGRSASAFAAQIGSMKLAEEVDAMRTIGLNPVEVLVLPRVIAMLLMMPLIGFYASIVAIAGGGLFAWVSLGIPPVTFVQRLQEVVPMSDFWLGLLKAPFFGLIIAITGCFQGMQVSGNAESVGERTTAAVVQAIFLVIVMDAFFAVFFTALGFV